MPELNHIKLSELNKKIEAVINNNFNELNFWIIADITEHSFKEKTGYHYFHFVEKDINSNKLLAKIPGKILCSLIPKRFNSATTNSK